MMDTAQILRTALEFSSISVHENGFLILRLPDGHSRLHLFHESVPRQKVATPIHNHRQDLMSVVLAGRIVNDFWDASPTYSPVTPPHLAHFCCDGPLTEQRGADVVYPRVYKRETIEAPGAYFVGAGYYHTSCPAPAAVTLALRGPNVLNRARVLVPVGVEPDNSFQRDGYDQRWLRELAEAIVTEARDYHYPD